ncbi:Hypothetical_protein [Hexamita inflata]|uniref:Hypothetical_protein n=1 Tax=Hexamita inflata TaxID=28002 RepID=A0AA86P1C2_9EUKA|nr:Hypothetical protein HINF_LOCUS17413 [Hexamita inflata]
MFKILVWNKLQFVANPGLVSIVLYRVILQLNSVVRLNSTERIIRINLCCFILQLLPRLSSQLKAVCFIFYHYTNFNQYFLIQDLDQKFSSSPVSFSRSSFLYLTLRTSDFFFSGIRSIQLYLTIILNIVEASHQGG